MNLAFCEYLTNDQQIFNHQERKIFIQIVVGIFKVDSNSQKFARYSISKYY